MRIVESKAATREEAIQSALEDLGVEMYEVDNIEILDEGSKGFLGFGARQVHVKLTVENLPDKPRHAQDRPKEERREQDRPRNDRQRNNRQRNDRKQDDRPQNSRPRNERKQEDRPRNERKQEDRPRNDRQRNDRNRPQRNDDDTAKPAARQERKPQNRNEQAPKPAERQERKSEVRKEEAASAVKEEQPQQRSSRGRGSRRRKAQAPREAVQAPRKAVVDQPARAPRPEVKEEAPAPREKRVQEEVNFDPISDEQGNEAAALLQEIIAKMDIEASVEFVRAEDETARLNVTSEDNAILIGRKGRNLSAMQYLINRMIARGDVAENTERLVVDAEGYIDRRRASLEELALSMASRAKEARRNFRLKPMSPQERRIIHVALQDDDDVRTYSLGDSLYRCVVISPKNAKPERGNSRRGGRGRGGRDRNENRERHNPHGHDGEVDAGTFGD